MASVRDIIDAAFDENAVGVKENLNAVLQDKIADALETKKIEVASSLITRESVEEEEIEDEDEDLEESTLEEADRDSKIADDEEKKGKKAKSNPRGLDALRDKQAAEKDDDWWGDKKSKPTKTLAGRSVKGSSYGGSKQAADKDEED